MTTPTLDPRRATFQRLIENYRDAQNNRHAAAHELRRITRHRHRDHRAHRRETRAVTRLAQAEDQLTHAAAQIASAHGHINHGLHQVTIYDARGRARLTLTI